MRSRIFVYGFSDYANVRGNPSAVVARVLKRYSTNKFEIRSAVFRVSYASVRRRLKKILSGRNYDLILGFGAAPGSRVVRLEKRAKRPPQARVGKRFLAGNLKLAPVLRALARKKIRARVSYDAGTYLCNFSYYVTAGMARGSKTKYCFVHLPLVRVKTQAGTHRYVTCSKSVLIRAARTILDAAIRQSDSHFDFRFGRDGGLVRRPQKMIGLKTNKRI